MLMRRALSLPAAPEPLATETQRETANQEAARLLDLRLAAL